MPICRDAPLNSLEALEPTGFDANRLLSLTPDVLQGLMKLTFVSDEKEAFDPLKPLNQRGPKQTHPCSGSSRRGSDDSDGKRLMRSLDADIARALGEEERNLGPTQVKLYSSSF